MRLVFLGTPPWAAAYLEPLLAAGHDIALVVTQPDRPGRRGSSPKAPATKKEALRLGLSIFQPEKINLADAVERLQAASPDALLVVAYGQILRQPLLDCPAIDALNVHYSLLPELRGPAPVQHALLQGLNRTGVSLQTLALGVDAGDIYAQRSTDIDPDENADALCRRLTDLGVATVIDALPDIAHGSLHPVAQDHSQATCAPLIEKPDLVLDLSADAAEIHNRVRAFAPRPGAYCLWEGRRLRVTKTALGSDSVLEAGVAGAIVEIDPDAGPLVQTGSGLLQLLRVQPEGRKEMDAASWLRGARLEPGDKLGSAVDKPQDI
jgi:methionyl-tRNA formyltransferase